MIVPFGSDVVVTVNGAVAAEITIDSCFVAVCTGEPESVAVTVKVNVPFAVGVPLIAPAELSVSPVGRVPGGTVHVTLPVPPLEARVAPA